MTTFSLILTLFFTFSLYCFDFCANTYFFFVNDGCPISCQSNGCSNNTPLVVNGWGTTMSIGEKMKCQQNVVNE